MYPLKHGIHLPLTKYYLLLSLQQKTNQMLNRGLLLLFPKKGDLGLAKNYEELQSLWYSKISSELNSARERNTYYSCAPLLFIIIFDYVLRTSVDKHPNLDFTLSERLSSRYRPKKTACVDYADDLALTFYTVANALLHHLGNAAKNVGFYVNVLKT